MQCCVACQPSGKIFIIKHDGRRRCRCIHNHCLAALINGKSDGTSYSAFTAKQFLKLKIVEMSMRWDEGGTKTTWTSLRRWFKFPIKPSLYTQYGYVRSGNCAIDQMMYAAKYWHTGSKCTFPFAWQMFCSCIHTCVCLCVICVDSGHSHNPALIRHHSKIIIFLLAFDNNGGGGVHIWLRRYQTHSLRVDHVLEVKLTDRCEICLLFLVLTQ